jgi:NAD(P)-dependent dehydrogenase (short-subunit alcohol dehydrogenase family)
LGTSEPCEGSGYATQVRQLVTIFFGAAAYRPSIGALIVGAVNLLLESLAQSLALELKPHRVNVISSGLVDSPTWDSMTAPDRQSMFTETAAALPVGGVGNVDDLAHAALAILEMDSSTGP